MWEFIFRGFKSSTPVPCSAEAKALTVTLPEKDEAKARHVCMKQRWGPEDEVVCWPPYRGLGLTLVSVKEVPGVA
jgi:hypothetical protein